MRRILGEDPRCSSARCAGNALLDVRGRHAMSSAQVPHPEQQRDDSYCQNPGSCSRGQPVGAASARSRAQPMGLFPRVFRGMMNASWAIAMAQ